MIAEALRLAGTNSQVLALAAYAAMKLIGDPERGEFLAKRALVANDSNIYALGAAGHAAALLGHRDESYRLCRAASEAAHGYPTEFVWDMHRALAALAIDQRDEALAYARRSHLGMGSYRPALRYLVALSALDGQIDKARTYAERLRRIEPGFVPSQLLRPDYPLETLRALGLHTQIARLAEL